MEQITQWVTDNWVLLLAIGAAIETLAGIIPDKWVPYIGAIRTFFRVLKGKGKTGTGVLEVIFGIFLAIGAIVYAIAGDDEADPECYAAQNASYYAQVELKDVTCSGNDCTVMVNGMPLKLNCSCEAHGACRRAE